ncbi:MAG: YDG domain-containing protein [Chitinispirillia bacterium]|nr:YDG domain-containing protein [Chitinispirillia bacterium]MCL2267666.1 YDG domain-containing protein [Chitinispirillia bacterium]
MGLRAFGGAWGRAVVLMVACFGAGAWAELAFTTGVTNGAVAKEYGASSFIITATGNAEGTTITYSATPEDQEVVTLNTSTGAVTINNAGTVTIKASAGDETATYTLNVAKKKVTLTIPTPNRVYDGTRNACNPCAPTISSTTPVVSGDVVTIGDGTGLFETKDAAGTTNKPITFNGFELGGASANNYERVLPTNQTGRITTLTLNAANLKVVHTKVFDNTTDAFGINPYSIWTPVAGDDIQVAAAVAGKYSAASAGTTTINLTGLSPLIGTDNKNYTISASLSNVPAIVSLTDTTRAGITKRDGLALTVPGDIAVEIAKNITSGTRNVSTLGLTAPSGLAATTITGKTYLVDTASYSSGGGLLKGVPTITTAGVLSFSSDTLDSGTAEVVVIIRNTNYNDVRVKYIFNATDKMGLPSTNLTFSSRTETWKSGSTFTMNAASVSTSGLVTGGGTFTIEYRKEGGEWDTGRPRFVNPDPGVYPVTVRASNGLYRGEKEATLTVNKAAPVAANLTYAAMSTYNKVYDASPVTVTVEWIEGFDGGPITVLYGGRDEPPSDAGTYDVKARVGENTYYNEADLNVGSFTISKKNISINAAESEVTPKVYNGNDSADIVSVAFTGTEGGQMLALDEDYTLTNPRFSTANVGASASATVVLVGAAAKNYNLAGSSFSKTGEFITKATPAKEHLDYDIPTNRRQTGTALRIDVKNKSPFTAMGAITVRHMQAGALVEPVLQGTYEVLVNVAGGANFVAAADISLGSYTILAPARSIEGAELTISGTYIYNGSPIRPSGGFDVEVRLADGTRLEPEVDYTIQYENNTNAGTATLTVNAIDAFKGTVSGTFDIAKKTLEFSDLAFPATVPYNGSVQPVSFKAVGLGTTAVTYDGSPTAPANAGSYEVVVTVQEGQNYTGLAEPVALGTYTIAKKAPEADDFDFTIPEGHLYTGSPRGIGPVTLPGTGYGSITVLYAGSENLPVEIGTYAVTVNVAGGDNYLAVSGVHLGDYKIEDPSAIAGGDRLIPGAPDDIAIVAPKNLLTARFTAGPNPVGRGSGAVEFYFEGGLIDGGKLTIYDALGNTVAEIACRGDRSSRSPAAFDGAKRPIGSWNLTDRKGRPVAEGTYLVSGAISVNGKRERIALVVGVR